MSNRTPTVNDLVAEIEAEMDRTWSQAHGAPARGDLEMLAEAEAHEDLDAANAVWEAEAEYDRTEAEGELLARHPLIASMSSDSLIRIVALAEGGEQVDDEVTTCAAILLERRLCSDKVLDGLLDDLERMELPADGGGADAFDFDDEAMELPPGGVVGGGETVDVPPPNFR